MVPVSLKIRNFRSVKGIAEFRFPQGPGLFFLWGENQEEERLEANGAGKSTLWEALTWCLFGKTSRGLKAGDVACWSLEKGESVGVDFSFELEPGAGELTIIRTWRPNSWVLVDAMGDQHDLTKDESNPLQDWLGVGFSAFLQSIVISQAQPMFLDLKADQKAALFAEVMQLDRWLDHSRKASEKAKDQDAETRRLDRELADAEGRFDQLEGQDLESLHRAWQDQRNARLEEMVNQHYKLLNKQVLVKEAKEEAAAVEARQRAAYRDLVEQEERFSDQWDIKCAEETKAFRLLSQCDLALGVAEKRWDRLKDESTCHACHQRIPEHQHAEQLAAANGDLLQAREDLRLAEGKHLAAKEAATRAKEDLSALRKKLNRAREAVDDAAARASAISREFTSLDHELDDLEEAADRLQAESSPYGELMAKAQQERGGLLRKMRELKAAKEASEERHAIYGYWVRWFKEIRLEQIGEALTQLEVEVNSCLNALGLMDWEVRFDIDRESKSGSIQRGFSVTIQSPHNSKPVPWEAWSGGESQRLRVATQQGLANLIRARTATRLELEVWDEPTQWMSGQGVQDLLESLSQRSAELGRQIWIVDHRSLGYGGFAGSAGAIKTKTGTHFDLKGLYRSENGGVPENSDDGTSHRQVDDGNRRRRSTPKD